MLLNSQFSSTNLSYELLFSKYDNEVELESDNANQNQNSITSSFFAASDQEFMQQFRDQIANELFQVFS